MDRETINRIVGIKESYNLSKVLLDKLLSEEKNELLTSFMEVGESLDHDWFTDYFQEEQGDRNALKQDFTPNSICEIVATIAGTAGNVGDICSGTGGLTLKMWQKGARDFFCIEYSKRATAILLFNLAIRNVKATILEADVLTQEVFKAYKLTPGERFSRISILEKENTDFSKLDSCIMNPPYSLKWDADKTRRSEERFKEYELAPKSKADYAFVLDGLHRLKDGGTLVAILPHGVLFRGGTEEKIRKKIIEQNLLDAVIGLPDKMFLNTAIPTCVLVLKKSREREDVLFIDASKECEKVGAYNRMEQEHIETLVASYKMRRNIERYAELHSLEKIAENDYNLNIPRYVDTYIPEPLPETLEESFRAMLEITREQIETEKEVLKFLGEMHATKDDELQKQLEAGRKSLEEMIDIDESRLEQLQICEFV